MNCWRFNVDYLWSEISVTWKYTWISYKCIQQTLREPLKISLMKYNWNAKKEKNGIIQNVQWQKNSGRQKQEEKGSEWKTVTNMVDINPTISKITSNINGLNSSIKRERLSECIEQDPP